MIVIINLFLLGRLDKPEIGNGMAIKKSLINKSKLNISFNRGRVKKKYSHNLFLKSKNTNWYFWVVLLLLLIAIIVYRVSFNLGLGTHR